MPKIRVQGKNELSGEIKISGAKNSAVALIPAVILSDEEVKLFNVPNVSDIDALEEILGYLNVNMKKNLDTLEFDTSNVINRDIPENICTKLRASYYFMGVLLGKFKKVEMYFPGGCSIGKRPINLHLKGFEALGAKIHEEDNHFIIEAEELIGDKIYLDFPSVGATINIMFAAVKAKGITTIENAAKEPEIVNIATFLNNMGAKIRGAGTSIIKIEGVGYLGKCFHEVIPDRIEAGTYIIMGALLGNELKVSNMIPGHVEALTSKLLEAGANLEIGEDYIIARKSNNLKAVDITTMVYPGFPTDLQQPFLSFLTQCEGTSKVEETIYENRLLNIPDTVKMGAKIDVIDIKNAIIYGPSELRGCEVEATDLRGGAALLVAALIADGITEIDNINHILRGYEGITEKLASVGAKIEII